MTTIFRPRTYNKDLAARDALKRRQQQRAQIPPCKNCGAVFPDNCNRAFYLESDCNLSVYARGLKL